MNKTRFKADHRDRISFHFISLLTNVEALPTNFGSIDLGIKLNCTHILYPKMYTDSYMTTTNISPSSIVVEVLRDDNYDDWSACMKSYMLAQDLWDFIEPSTGHHEGDQETLII